MRDKIVVFSFLTVILGFFLLNLILPDQELSYSERRHFSLFPKITLDKVMNKEAMDDFEDYTLDQFPMRDTFRSFKANLEFNVFQKLDNNKIFVKDGSIFKTEYPLDPKSISNFTTKINKIIETYLKEANVYYAIVPDKNYYLEDNTYLRLDYAKLFDLVKTGLNGVTEIRLDDLLKLEDYYYTDTHWKQENLNKIVKRLSDKMGFEMQNPTYEKKLYEPFYGVYYGQAALKKIKPDTITYLTNTILNDAKVTYYGETQNGKIYYEEKLGSMDSYDVYLKGATPLITIENKHAQNDRELIIFRDSFGSSLTPLLVSAYQKITVVDMRYINTKTLETLVEFKDQDVLFLYSTLIINQSGTLKD